MGRGNAGEEQIRTLTQVGGDTSYSVTLPIEGVRELGWQDGQKLVVELDSANKRFIIRDKQ